MSDKPISLEQGIQILSRAFGSLRGNPPGWEDQSQVGGTPGDVARIPRPRHGLGGEDDPSAYAPVDPGMGGPHVPGDPPGWSPRAYASGDLASYGPHNPVLSDQEAATLHLVWSILGIDGSTVGKGSVVPSPTTAEPNAQPHDKRMI